jgi:hypothetical protein
VPEPFFNLAPVEIAEFARRVRRYSMLTPEKLKELLDALAKTSLSPEEQSAIISSCASGAAAPAEEPMPMPEEGAAIEAAAQPPELAASVSLLATRLATLEAGQKKRETEESATLFASYKAQGKLRYAVEAEAKKLLEGSGIAAFKVAYSHVPALTGQGSPKAPGRLPTAAEVAAEPAEYAPSPEQLKAYSKQHGVGLSKALVALRKAPPATR